MSAEHETFITQELINKLLTIFTSTTTDNSSNTFLDHISEIDSDKIVKYLIETGFDVNAKDSQGETAIIKAILNNNEKIVRILIKCGAIIDHTYYPNYNGPLHVAAEGYVELTKMLVDAGCDVNAKNKIEITPLIAAIRMGNIRTTKILLDAGASRDHTFYKRNNGPLLIACRLPNFEIVKLLVHAGCKVSVVDDYHNTPLHLTIDYLHCRAMKKEIVKILIEAGCDVNVKNYYGFTALRQAVYNNNEDIVEILLKAGADPNVFDNEGNSLLHISVRYNKNISLVKRLIDAGANVNALDFAGRSCVFHAARCASVELLNLLIDNGAILDLIDHINTDLLYYALKNWGCHLRYFENREFLRFPPIDYDLRIEDTFGKNMVKNHIECTKILFKHGVKINFIMQCDYLVIFGPDNFHIHSQIICKLLRQGAILNFESSDKHDEFISSDFCLKLSRIFIRYVVICNSYKNGNGIINFDFEKLNEKQKQYYKDCENELEKLKNFLVYESMPLSNLIEGPVSSSYILNENLKQIFESGFITKSYPIYNDVLIEHYENKREMYELLLDATAGLQRLINFNNYSVDLIYHNILKYLGTRDRRIVASFAKTEICESTDMS